VAQYVLAVDHGTSGVKTALVSVRGEVVDFEAEATRTTYLPGGGAEQDPGEWWSALLRTARRLVERGRVPVEEIVAVGCSSTFSSTVAVDARGRHLAPSLTWLDSRGAPYVRRKMRGLVSIGGYGLRNLLRFVPITGGGPTLSGKDSVAHVLFWKHERPEVYRAADKFLESKDYLNGRLTGRLAASYDSATLFWVTDNRDVEHVRYHPGLIRRLGLRRSQLAPLKRSTDMLGPLLPDVAEAIGLPRPVPVVVGSPDLQSACVGSGAVRDYEGHVYVGTSSWVLCHLPEKRTDVLHSVACLPSAIPGRYFCANEQDMAGGCLSFLVDNVLYHDNRLRRGAPPEDVYATLDAIVSDVPAGAGNLIFTPWLNGERSPVDSETLRGGLHNVSVSTTVDHIARAVYEGVAMNTRWVLGYVEKLVGRRLDPLNMIGGGAQSDVWCQIFADVLGRTIRQVEAPLQANARGAAFLASVALGRLRFDEIPALVPIAGTFRPNPNHRRLYDGLFREFVHLYRATRGVYARLNR